MPTVTLDLTRDFDEIRGLFPVTRTQTYLMNAAQSPLNTRSRAALDSYLDAASVDLDARPSVREPIRSLLAGLLESYIGRATLPQSCNSGARHPQRVGYYQPCPRRTDARREHR